MYGIDLNAPVEYRYASLRFFAEKEHHVKRFCEDDVLLLVYEGVLRFTEDGTQYEIFPGQYHVQKQNTYQSGELASDGPKYLYVHFRAGWKEGENVLPKSGSFDCGALKHDMEKLNRLHHAKAPRILQTAVFYAILSKLYRPLTSDSPAARMADYLKDHYKQGADLDSLCRMFSYSKNYIIQLFKKELGQTPIAFLNTVRLMEAEQRLITTSEPIEAIALDCGYRNYSHFYHQFVRKNGASPEAFRRKKHLGT